MNIIKQLVNITKRLQESLERVTEPVIKPIERVAESLENFPDEELSTKRDESSIANEFPVELSNVLVGLGFTEEWDHKSESVYYHAEFGKQRTRIDSLENDSFQVARTFKGEVSREIIATDLSSKEMETLIDTAFSGRADVRIEEVPAAETEQAILRENLSILGSKINGRDQITFGFPLLNHSYTDDQFLTIVEEQHERADILALAKDYPSSKLKEMSETSYLEWSSEDLQNVRSNPEIFKYLAMTHDKRIDDWRTITAEYGSEIKERVVDLCEAENERSFRNPVGDTLDVKISKLCNDINSKIQSNDVEMSLNSIHSYIINDMLEHKEENPYPNIFTPSIAEYSKGSERLADEILEIEGRLDTRAYFSDRAVDFYYDKPERVEIDEEDVSILHFKNHIETQKDGRLHSFNNQPSLIIGNDRNYLQWHKEGNLHSFNGKPAVQIAGEHVAHLGCSEGAVFKAWYDNGEEKNIVGPYSKVEELETETSHYRIGDKYELKVLESVTGEQNTAVYLSTASNSYNDSILIETTDAILKEIRANGIVSVDTVEKEYLKTIDAYNSIHASSQSIEIDVEHVSHEESFVHSLNTNPDIVFVGDDFELKKNYMRDLEEFGNALIEDAAFREGTGERVKGTLIEDVLWKGVYEKDSLPLMDDVEKYVSQMKKYDQFISEVETTFSKHEWDEKLSDCLLAKLANGDVKLNSVETHFEVTKEKNGNRGIEFIDKVNMSLPLNESIYALHLREKESQGNDVFDSFREFGKQLASEVKNQLQSFIDKSKITMDNLSEVIDTAVRTEADSWNVGISDERFKGEIVVAKRFDTDNKLKGFITKNEDGCTSYSLNHNTVKAEYFGESLNSVITMNKSVETLEHLREGLRIQEEKLLSKNEIEKIPENVKDSGIDL